jgi:hypothetical protein
LVTENGQIRMEGSRTSLRQDAEHKEERRAGNVGGARVEPKVR